MGVATIGCFDLRVRAGAPKDHPDVEVSPVRGGPIERTRDAVSATATTEQPTATGSVTGQRMRAIIQTEYGTADVLRVAEIKRPVIGADEVLVKVRAAGLDRGTWHLMAGLPYAARLVVGLRAPKNPVPGLDVAGVVVAVGSEVTRFQPGDEVFGVGKGSFAEFVAARESKLAPKPSNLTFEQAAAVPVSGMTALRGLTDVGRLQAGQKVLIIGASGGVGSYAVQIAKAVGAEVTGVCSTSKLDLVRSIGADHVIDYSQDDFANGAKRYDLILDTGGNSTLSRLRRALTPRGTLVIVGGEGGGRLTGPSTARRRPVTSCPPATDHARPQRALHRPRAPDRTDRGRPTGSRDRAGLSARGDAERHATPRSRTSTRQARHRRQLHVDPWKLRSPRRSYGLRWALLGLAA
jgi:NADPH:quinone reductase-like Zn-dependent oxidoreductase